MNSNKLIISVVPIFILLVELFFPFSQFFGNRDVVLTLILALWMVTWWVLEVLPLGITALFPLFYFPFLGIISIKDVTPAYSNPVIFLFLGGFIIARALEKTKLDERIALSILLKTGKSDKGIILGFVMSTAFLSMWISNTATTVMMVPIALSVTHFLQNNLKEQSLTQLPAFKTVLFLSIAYSANIGGIMTPIGTPPNVVFIGYLSDLAGRQIDFYKWILATAPLALILLWVMGLLLSKIFPYKIKLPKNFRIFIQAQFKKLGPMGSSQKITISVFVLAASLWIFKDLLNWAIGLTALNDTSIAIFCGVLLFLVPSRENKNSPVLNHCDIGQLPWNIVLLFGGGMALASGLKDVGLIEMATHGLGRFDLKSPFLLISLLGAMTLFLTEIMSNVALCVVALPLIMKLGESQGIDPLLIAMPAALCASFAFSMPISTPPNAIVFGTQAVRVNQMLRAGIILNFIALGLTMSLGYWLIQTIML